MENLVFTLVENKLTINDICELEDFLGLKFPIEFVNHYLQFNGGYPNANWSSGEEINYPFGYFFSIKYGKETIEEKLEEFKTLGFDYGAKIIFAIKDIRYTFYIDLSKDTYGQIFVRKPKYIKEKKNYDLLEGTWEYHCANFTDFLNGLNQINYKP